MKIIRPNFKSKYPLLNEIITNEFDRFRLMNDKEFYEIYIKYNFTIKTFIYEIKKYFDEEMVKKLVNNIISTLERNILPSFFRAYLNSSDLVKTNELVVDYFKKTLILGKDSLNYIEENGIIADESYKNIPNIIDEFAIKVVEKIKEEDTIKLNEIYNQVKEGNETFKNQSIDDIFDELSVKEKQLTIEFIQADAFKELDSIFEPMNVTYKRLIKVLSKMEINSIILNKITKSLIGKKNLLVMICTLIEYPFPKLIIENLNILIINGKYELIKELLEKRLITHLGILTPLEVENYNDTQIIDSLSVELLKLRRRVS